jgi:5-methylcytosine-specific restriction endonuclease McrA
MDYISYIASHRWRKNPARLREFATAGGKCRLCAAVRSAATPLEAHHRDYDNLGNEQDGDLVALCGECHREVTSFLRRRRYRSRSPLRSDVRRMRDGRATLCDPSRTEWVR